MSKPERVLAAAGVAVVASAALLVAYVRQSNPADAQAAGCAQQRAQLGQTLDQIRFSTSAAHATAGALRDTTAARDKYAAMIVAMRHDSAITALEPRAHDRVRDDLAQASWILGMQDDALHRASALLTTAHAHALELGLAEGPAHLGDLRSRPAQCRRE